MDKEKLMSMIVKYLQLMPEDKLRLVLLIVSRLK